MLDAEEGANLNAREGAEQGMRIGAKLFAGNVFLGYFTTA